MLKNRADGSSEERQRGMGVKKTYRVQKKKRELFPNMCPPKELYIMN